MFSLFLFVVHRQRPVRLLLLHRRNPWPWPTTATWICKQTCIPQREDEEINCLQIVVWWPFCHFYHKGRKKKATCTREGWWKVGNLPPSQNAKVQVDCLVICLVLVSWGRYTQRLLMTFKDETTEHLTFDFVSSVLDLCKRKCHKAFG